MILNEIATNSLKHAFGPDGGSIKVRLDGGIDYGQSRLTLSDNGRDMSKPDRAGSGLKLIASLARQIGGTFDQESTDRGTISSIVFR